MSIRETPLPTDWKIVKFGDICKVQGGFAFKSSDYTQDGIPLIRISNLVNGKVSIDSNTVRLSPAKLIEHSEFNLQKGDTLIAMSGATTGKMATFDLDEVALLNQRVGRFRILSESICFPRFITLLVSQLTAKVLKEAYGAAQPNISPSQIEQIEVPLPPIEEQRRIVAEIEKQFTRLDAGVTALKRTQANLKRYRVAVLKAACEGRLVVNESELTRADGRDYESGSQLLELILEDRRRQWNGRGKYNEPVTPDTANLPKLPDGWTVASLEQLTSSNRVICYGILMPKEHVPDGIPYVKVRDMKGDKIDFDSLPRTSHEIAAQYARASLKVGDILLSIRGTYGRVAEVPPELEGGNITQDTARIAVTPFVERSYISWFLRSNDAQNYFKRVARGVAVKGVNIGDVKPCPVFLPPLAEQSRIVAEVERRLSVIDELEATVAANSQRAAGLRQAILRKAFSGEL